MKKYILGLILLAMFALPLAYSANAVSIAELQALIARLTAQLKELQQQQNVTPNWCHNFNANLGVGSRTCAGDSNVETASVETALVREGLLTQHEGDCVSFDEKIASAVVKFQKKYGIIQTGYVGPLTRAKLNALYKCRANNNSQITINSVSGPTSLNVGQTGTWSVNVTAPSGTNLSYSVDWGDSGYSPITGAKIASSPVVSQTSTFTHSYIQAGTYTVKFIVSDLSKCGGIAKCAGANVPVETSVTVVVGRVVNQNLSIAFPADPVNWHDYVGEPYSKTFSVVNSTAVRHHTWSISGTLPPGLVTRTDSGVKCANAPCPSGNELFRIYGTPTRPGNFPFTLTVRDDLGNTGSLNLNINIEGFI